MRIRVPEVRLIGPAGEQLGVFQTTDAMAKAQDCGLDLVEISPTARPPVCRIMDYGKYKYEQSKKAAEARKHQVVVQTKEVKIRPSIGEHDLEVKYTLIRKFLKAGQRAKITIQFRGREMAHKDRGQDLLRRVITDMSNVGVPEQEPKFEGRLLCVILLPGKAKPVSRPRIVPPAATVATTKGIEHAKTQDEQRGEKALQVDQVR